ncbi:MAG: lamin tail domain-containing protein, partial [Verrucomicrobiota bacterium]
MTASTTRGRMKRARRYAALGVITVLMAFMGAVPTRMSAAGAAPRVFISEVHPSGSGNTSYKADWFEVTNTGTTAVDITGWKMDDDNSAGGPVALNGVTSIAPGQSVVFIESSAPVDIGAFQTAWFGSNVPADFTIGTYGGTGVGLSTSGDGVSLFDSGGIKVTGVSFSGATAARTFDNTAGFGSTTVSTLSTAGVNGAFLSADGKETGSPGKRINASPLSGIDLSLYTRIARYALPEPTTTTPPDGVSLLAQEASAVTYDWDTDTLFVVGDGGTSIVQVSKTGQLIDSMTLAQGGSPQGTDFYDPEGLTYVGGGKFVMSEERDRQVVLFKYVPGTTLHRGDAQTVKLGSFVENIGNEGVSFDPATTTPTTRGFIIVKEISPEGVFQTNVDFVAGSASNGSATTEPTNLFNPALANLSDFADVFALSNLPSLTGPDSGHLLVLSQEAGKIVNISRTGAVANSLTIQPDANDRLSIPDMQHEGVTMDFNGILYVVNENGGGDINHPQLWVYAPSAVPNQPPTALALNNQVNSIAENTSTVLRLKVADVVITDDGIGTNNLTVTGADAGFFEVDSTGLYIKAGTILDFEAKSTYSVTVAVDDPTAGGTPDATAAYALALVDVPNENPGPSTPLVISEVSPWSSTAANAAYAADWFEVTNTGTSDVSIAGWRMDDNSNAFGSSVALRGVATIPAGRSAVFFEGNATGSTDAAILAAFSTAWFGSATPPAGVLIGAYGGSGVGLSNDGDAVNLFDASGNRVTGVSFGASTAGRTFDNTAG